MMLPVNHQLKLVANAGRLKPTPRNQRYRNAARGVVG
jgi:hypothetical protein